jgi:hypothetical protein
MSMRTIRACEYGLRKVFAHSVRGNSTSAV